MRRLLLSSFVSVAALIATNAWPSEASAAEVIGQSGSGFGCADGLSYVQAQEAPGTPRYTPATNGVITSWSAMAEGTADRTLQLLVLRPDSGAGLNNFIAVQKDAVRTLTELNSLNTFTSGVGLPIEAGDRLGLYVPDGQPGGSGTCDIGSFTAGDNLRWYGAEAPLGTSVDFSGGNFERLNASAVVEPDCDRDTLGDETQDTNLSACVPPPASVPPASVPPASVTGQRAAAIKKCKKKFPGKAKAKKRKKCIKKAKKLPV
jgi:hypothetical protein